MSKKLSEKHPLALEKAKLYMERTKTESEVADWNARAENFNSRLVAEGFPAEAGLFKRKLVINSQGEAVVRTVYN